ncbi:MAG: TonB-dependent receptor [Myxococcota bacterium]
MDHRPLPLLTCIPLCLLGAPVLAQTQVDAATETPAEPSSPTEDRDPASSDATPKLTPPELITFVEANYPPRRRAAGEEGTVELELDIDADGRVRDARVVTTAGDDFDTAALAAARRFIFAPARRFGDPIPSRIRYRYNFSLADDAPAETEEVAAEGALGGRVLFAGDRPLVGAKVRLTGPEGIDVATQTVRGGRFDFPSLRPGRYRIRVEAEGFGRYSGAETVEADIGLDVTYRLEVAAELDEVVVRGERLASERPPREVTRRTLSRRELNRIPGTAADALRSVQSLPGVARPPALAGLLIVRGSAPQDTGIFVDQSNVPLIYHFGGLASVIPTEMIERIDFYPSNFGVRFGRVQGGIVDVGLRAPDTTCRTDGEPERDERGSPVEGCFHAMGQLDLIDARVMASGPLGGDWSFAIAARRSWVDAWIGAVLTGDGGGPAVSSAPVYYDYQAIAEYRPDDRNRVSLRVFGSDDRTRLIFDEPPQPGLGGSLGLSTRFIRAQALAESQITDELKLTGMFAGGWEAVQFSAGNNLFFDFDNFPLELRGEASWRIADNVTWNTGLDYLVEPATVRVIAPTPPRPGEQAPGTLVAAPTFETDRRTVQHRPAVFTEMDVTFFDRLRLVPGVRVDHTRFGSGFEVSPRIHGRYRLLGPDLGAQPATWKPRTTLKGGIGRFTQPPQGQETDPVFGTPGLINQRAMHYALGVEQDITRQVELSVEGFYKDLDALVSRSPTGGAFAYDNQGEGRVFGGEMLLKYKPDDFFFGWVAYSLSRSVRRDQPGDPERLFQFDQTHNLTVLGSFRLPWGIEAGARFRLISGSPFTPVQRDPAAILATDGSEYIPLSGAPFSDRLPLFHQLDVRVDKTWQFKAWALSTYLDVQNVYNRQAREGVSYNYNFTQEQFTMGLPILPSLGLRGEI